MAEIDDGNTAFPTDASAQGIEPTSGMSLRDYFAAAALTGILTDSTGITKEVVTGAYQIADAMLKARKP